MAARFVDAFVADVRAACERALPLARQVTTSRMVHRRDGDSRWDGREEQVPDIHGICLRLKESGFPLGHGIDAVLQSEYPGRYEMRLPTPYVFQTLTGSAMVVAALGRLLRGSSLKPSEASLGHLAESARAFVERPTLRLRYYAPLLGFRLCAGADSDVSIDLGRATIRRLGDDEATLLYSQRGQYPRSAWLITGDFEDDLAHEGPYDAAKRTPAFVDVANVVTALRTWRSGAVAVPDVWFGPAQWHPIPMGTFGLSTQEAHFSTYDFDPGATQEFREHFRKVADPTLHGSLRFAIDRLSDAEGRRHPRDAVVDAVVGLEAILLHVAGRDEMSYRFRLYYAALQPIADRSEAFKRARRVYEARSAIVHGEQPHEDGGVGAHS